MMRRRDFLRGVGVTWGGFTLGGAKLIADVTGSGSHIDFGVASGDPGTTSVNLWTMIPQPIKATSFDAIPVIVEISTDINFPKNKIIDFSELETSAQQNYSVHYRAENLEPNHIYYYRFHSPGFTSVTGRTRTAPIQLAPGQNVKFAAMSCQSYTHGFYTVYENLIYDQVDFCVHLGDFIYEDGRKKTFVREDTVGLAETLDDYRAKYRLYLSDPYLREVRRLYPWIYIWDDHEVENNYCGGESKYHSRMSAGYQAYAEFMPINRKFYYDHSGKPSLDLYRKIQWGADLELFALDTRQYRTEQPCLSSHLTLGCTDFNDPSHTILGQGQKQWLLNGLSASSSRWKFLLNQVMFMPMLITKPKEKSLRAISETLAAVLGFSEQKHLFLNLDGWDGFPAERQTILDHLHNDQIDNVVVVTGDIHSCFYAPLTIDPFDRRSQKVATEVVCPSVTSATVGDIVRVKQLEGVVEKVLYGANPHMDFLDVGTHCYTKFDVGEDEVFVSYVGVDTITKKTAQAFLLKQLKIPAA